MTIRPTDGLVTRLLQQQSRPTHASSAKGEAMRGTDQISISSQAREQNLAQFSNSYGQKQEQLESKLIGLYAKHARFESKD